MWRKYRRIRGNWLRRVEVFCAGLILFAAAWTATAALGPQDVEIWARRMLPPEQQHQVATDDSPAKSHSSDNSVGNSRVPFPFLVTVDVNQNFGPGLARQTRLFVVWIFGMTFQVDSRRI